MILSPVASNNIIDIANGIRSGFMGEVFAASKSLYMFCAGVAIILFGVRVIMGKDDFYQEIQRIITMCLIFFGIMELFPVIDSAINPIINSLNSQVGETTYGKLETVYAAFTDNLDWNDYFSPAVWVMGIGFFVMPIMLAVFPAIQAIVYTLLAAFGPIAIALSLLKPFQNSFNHWLGNIVKVKFWLVTEAILLKMLLYFTSAFGAESKMDNVGDKVGELFANTEVYTMLIICYVFIVLYCFIPKLTSLYINAGAEAAGVAGIFVSPAAQGAQMAASQGLGGGSAASSTASVSPSPSSASANPYKPS